MVACQDGNSHVTLLVKTTAEVEKTIKRSQTCSYISKLLNGGRKAVIINRTVKRISSNVSAIM